MMNVRWTETPAVTGIVDGKIYRYRAGAAFVGRGFDVIIIQVDHPELQHWRSADWLLSHVRTRLNPDGQWIEVTDARS